MAGNKQSESAQSVELTGSVSPVQGDAETHSTVPEEVKLTRAQHSPAREISPLIQQAEAAFRRDLEQLLKERPGQWVAYRGEKPVAFADDDFELARECLDRGISRSEFIIRLIDAEQGDEMISGKAQSQDGYEFRRSNVFALGTKNSLAPRIAYIFGSDPGPMELP
jgi:hypothetical protein